MDAAALGWLVGMAVRATLVMAVAALGTLLMGRAPARLRGVVWATALAGAVLVPGASLVLPPLEVPLPGIAIPRPAAVAPATVETPPAAVAQAGAGHLRRAVDRGERIAAPRSSPREPWWPVALVAVWAAVGLAVGATQVAGVVRLRGVVRRARPLDQPDWRRILDSEVRRVGLGRRPRMVMTSELSVPATAGLLRPVVLLPEEARSWIAERRVVVVRHELVHVARSDWAVRMVARAACALYWFNPLTWWAWHRLAVDQELACDQEVIALGARPSTYAAHLLAVARLALARPALTSGALEMARRSYLEGRIMAVLDPNRFRHIGTLVLASAAILTLGLAVTVAAVTPASADPSRPAPVRASAEIRDIVNQMKALEERIEERARSIEAVEDEMRPQIEAAEAAAERIGEIHVAEIEAGLEPLEQRMRELEAEMEPLHEQMAELAASLEPLHGRIEVDTAEIRERLAELDGDLSDLGETVSLDEVMERIHRVLEPLHERVESVHLEMEPRLAELERMHERLEPLHRQMEAVHREMEPVLAEIEARHREMEPGLAELEGLDEVLEPLNQRIRAFSEEIEPLTEELGALSDRLMEELGKEVGSILRRELAGAVDAGAPFDEAAERLIARSRTIHLESGVISLQLSRLETRRVLADMLAPHRRAEVGEAELEAALDRAVEAVRSFEIELD